MAAGLGYKEFTTGDVLTAADANGYLASQVVMVFADAAARTTAITSPQEGMISFRKDADAMEYYSGSAWVAVDSGTSPLTTKGDLFTFSTLNARLGVGANGTVLTADSAEATGLKWATPAAASSGMTLITRTTFSNQASQAFDNVFTSSYFNYLVVIDEIYAATATDDLQLQFRYAGPTTQTSAYYGASVSTNYSGVSATTATNNQAQFTISAATGASTNTGAGQLFINGVGNTSEVVKWRGQHVDDNGSSYIFAGVNVTNRTYTGFLLKSSSTNITGAVSIYGLAKA